MKTKGFSLTEIMISLAIAVTVLIPVLSMFSTSAQTVQKTLNFSFATSLARRISQHMVAMPFSEIESVPLPGVALYNSADDPYFCPLFNFSDNAAGAININNEDFKEFRNYLQKHDFRYALSVINVNFGDGDEMKSVAIRITWNDSGKDMMYQTNVYIPAI
jgi:prepilin-type N-terminal cleavage/methylation domain-containing protein